MNKYFRIIAAMGIATLACSCVFDNGPKKTDEPTLPKANTFTDFQHIGGRVSGVWTKANNPVGAAFCVLSSSAKMGISVTCC